MIFAFLFKVKVRVKVIVKMERALIFPVNLHIHLTDHTAVYNRLQMLVARLVSKAEITFLMSMFNLLVL